MTEEKGRKQSLYFPEEMLREIKDLALRLDRTISWIMQRAWKIARAEIKAIPGDNDPDNAPTTSYKKEESDNEPTSEYEALDPQRRIP